MVAGWKHRAYLQGCILALALLGVTASLVPFSHASEIDSVRMAIEAKGGRWVANENPISLLPKEERMKKLGLVKPFGKDLPVRAALSSPVGLPVSLDWRDYDGENYVTPVRDQGNCGSCWAFSTTAALESYTLISNATPGIDLDLAEQILVSCSSAGDCNGGYIDDASDFIEDTGLPLETCYPYTETNGNCSNACANWQSSTYTIPSWQYVATYSPTVNVLKEGLSAYGPLPTTMAVYTDFYYYDGGIYSYTSGSLQGYHAVLLVGYDDAEQCFIVKNSWNTWWGESGYFRIAYSEVNSVVGFGEFTIAYGTGVVDPESISTPAEPSGPASGVPGTSYTYTVGGAVSSLGHDVQYLIDWGNGSNSGWLPLGTLSASKSWSTSGTYAVRAKARCVTHTDVESDWSESLSVSIETVSAPTVPSGPASGAPGISYTYMAGGAASSLGHAVQYLIDWGDGSDSDWLPQGTLSASKSWDAAGTYLVRAKARCVTHPDVESGWSGSLSVSISDTAYPAVMVLNPNGGDRIPSGSLYTIQWGAPAGTVKFTVRYSMDNGVAWNAIAKKAPGNSLAWTVPKPSANKKKCLIKVTGYDETGTVKLSEDVSDAPFTIEVVRLDSPNGGETLRSKDRTEIRWTTLQTVRPVKKVKLYYTNNNGTTWIFSKALEGNPERAPWIVPPVLGRKTNCKVKVVLLDAKGYSVGSDVSDSTFTINP